MFIFTFRLQINFQNTSWVFVFKFLFEIIYVYIRVIPFAIHIRISSLFSSKYSHIWYVNIVSLHKPLFQVCRREITIRFQLIGYNISNPSLSRMFFATLVASSTRMSFYEFLNLQNYIKNINLC